MKLLDAIGFGVASGAVIALGAVGFTVQFAVSNYFNVAYGALLTLAAFIGFWLLSLGINVWIALVIAALSTAIVSALINRSLVTPLKKRGAGSINLIVATVSIGLILQYVLVAIVGPNPKTYGRVSGSTVHVLWFVLTQGQLILIGISAALMVGFHLLLTRTRLGRAMRATSSNPTLARASGIRVARIIDISWLLTGAMCGVAGVALAITTVAFDFNLGTSSMIYMIAGAIVGGVGQPYGAMAGGLVVGLASQLVGAYSNPAYEDVVAFGILAVVLIIRPQGLLGSPGGGVRLRD
jgi:branched-subunit amino acid ABC-type transport system permease component